MTELPEGWAAVRLGDVLRLINGFPFKPHQWSVRGKPIIRIQNLNNPAAAFNRFEGDLLPKFRVQNGDLLFAWSGTPGTSFGAHIWAGAAAWLNQHIFRVEFDDSMFDKRFLRLAINNNLSAYIEQAHGGAGLAHITKKKFEESLLVVPPLAEQRRIVEKVETLFARINATDDRLQRTVRVLEASRASTLATAYRGQFDSKPFLRRTTTVRELTVSSFYGPRFASTDYSDDGVPTVRTTDIDFAGRINLKSAPRVRITQGDERFLLQEGDLLITRTGATIGKCALYHTWIGPAVPSAYLIRFRFDRTLVIPEYMLLYLQSPVGQSSLGARQTAVAQPNVNAEAIKAFEFNLPTIEDQKRAVTIVADLMKAIDAATTRGATAAAVLKNLRQSVLAKAFAGELVPTEAELARRPASVEHVRTKAGQKPLRKVRSQ